MGLLPAEPQTIINMRSLCAEVLNMAAMNGATCMPANERVLGKVAWPKWELTKQFQRTRFTLALVCNERSRIYGR